MSDQETEVGEMKQKDSVKYLEDICVLTETTDVQHISKPTVRRFTWCQKSSTIQRRLWVSDSSQKDMELVVWCSNVNVNTETEINEPHPNSKFANWQKVKNNIWALNISLNFRQLVRGIFTPTQLLRD